MTKRLFILKLVIAVMLIAIFIVLPYAFVKATRSNIEISESIAGKTWTGYKRYFIDENGRVRRPREGDTVSEGQAYAMLRAVWMDDKETFDKCYRWSENNLSRCVETGDNLLAWHWKNNEVSDWMPASDADVDYALSLILADSRWKNNTPVGIEDYGEKARKVLEDILDFETFSTASGRLYLSPWILAENERVGRTPLNPSYYSPAHFRVFYEFSNDKRWLSLADTTYYILNTLSRSFNGKNGVGLMPDWCSVDSNDGFYPLEGRNREFGWEAVRIPIRVAMDYFWFGSREAKGLFDSGLSRFIEEEWQKNGVLFCEYNYDGTPFNKYENPLFYASYTLALLVTGSEQAKGLLAKTREYIKKEGGNYIYLDSREYYVNSLAWFPEGFISNRIKRFE